MSRDSRPPGFDMTFRPEEARRFGPPTRSCLPAYGFFAICLVFVGFVTFGYASAPGTFAHRYVVEAGAERLMPASWFALLVFGAGLAGVLRTHMRGVVVHPDGIETLELLLLGMPRVRRYEWAMIDRFRFEDGRVLVDLWNGTVALLPIVAERDELSRELAYVAAARAIPAVGAPLIELDPDDARHPQSATR